MSFSNIFVVVARTITAALLVFLIGCSESPQDPPKANSKLSTEIVNREMQYAWAKLIANTESKPTIENVKMMLVTREDDSPIAKVTVSLTVTGIGAPRVEQKDFVFRVIGEEWRVYDRDLEDKNSSTVSRLGNLAQSVSR